MAYGQGEYGQRDYGGSSFEGGGPQLVSSDPLNGASGVLPNATISFIIGSEAGLDINTLSLEIEGAQAIVGGVFLSGYAGTIEFLDDETQLEVVVSTHPDFDIGANAFDIDITDLAGEAGALSFSFTVPFIVTETLTLTEDLEVLLNVALQETLTLTESVTVGNDIVLLLPEQLSITEQVFTGIFEVENIGGFQFLVTLAQELHFDTITDLEHYRILPNALNPGVPLTILSVEPQYTTYQDGSNGRFIPEPSGTSYDFDGETHTFEFEGSLDPEDLGDFIHVISGPNTGLYQILESTDMGGGLVRASLGRSAVVDVESNGSVHLAGSLEDVPRIDLVSIRNEGGNPAMGATPDYVYTFQVVDPRVTVGTPILSVYRVERLARSGVEGLDADVDAINPPAKVTPTFSEVLDPETSTVLGHLFDVTTDLTILDYQTFEVRDPTLVTSGAVLRATSGLPPIGGVPTAVTGSYEGFAAVVQLEGSVEWAHSSGVTGVLLNTTKMTGLATYDVQVVEVFLKRPKIRFSTPVAEVLAIDVPKPQLTEANPSEDGLVHVFFDYDMQSDDGNLNNPEDYSITGPSDVFVQRVYGLGTRQVSLFTQGLLDGDYTLTVSSATPKDIAGNPLDPTFNTAIFTASTPLNTRSIFTDRGPIMRPPLTLQSGVASTLEIPDEITLTGAALTLTDIGQRLYLTNSEKNDGNYRILSILSSERARVQASFALPDANNGTIDWEIINPRHGQIADDPSDVTVRVNGTPVVPDAVIGLRGQVVLDGVPIDADDVEIDYTWGHNPKVEIRRLNSKEFRLNAWNRDYGGVTDSRHHYRYNNVLVTPSDYDPDDLKAGRPSPLLRQLKYRAYERAYTAVLNDPTLLVLNTPNHKIAFPPAFRPLSEVVSFYEGLVLPEANNPSWVRHGGGTASAAAGVLTLTDDSTGTFPAGEPLFWTQALDLSFEHVFSAAWRFSLDTVTTLEGIWTGIAAGYSDETQVYVVGYLDDGGTKKIGFLKRGAQDDIASLSAWTGGVDEDDVLTGVPVEFDWSILHSYRLFTDQEGVVKLYVDGDVVETLRITPSEAPFLKELNAPFDEIQGAFFGSLSRPAQSSSSWDFYRYFIQPTNVQQVSSSSFVSYEATVVPELDPAPWTPIGFHGTSTILSSNLILEATSASDALGVGLMGGDFHGYVKLEPLLSQASQFSVDFEMQLLTFTHGINPNGLMMAVDDGTRLMQLCFFQERTLPRLSYGGRSFPEDYSPYVWQVLGTQVSEMVGRYLRITDTDTADGLVYFLEDTAPAASEDRVLGVSNDYFVEARCRVDSFTEDGSGFAGAFVQAFDGVRAVGFYLQEVAGVRSVRMHSDGVPVGATFAFEWNDGDFHTFRLRKSTTGNLVSLFADTVFLGSVAYSSFATPTPDVIGILSFGSSTAASAQAESEVTWAYCNAWRVNTEVDPILAPRKYVGLWKGSNNGSLLDYHLPLKASGLGAAVVGNTLVDPLANFVAALVSQGDRLLVDVGSNQGTFYVDNVVNATTLTLTTAWGTQPSQVDYRIVNETDWSVSSKYRLVKDPNGSLSVFLEADTIPLLTASYNSLDLPESATGVVSTLSNGLAALAFGSFNQEHLAQSQWDFVRYGITKYSGDQRVVPPHQILNQWNTMESPERLYTVIPHTRTSFKSSSTGTTSQEVVDFLSLDEDAFTQLNETTPLVPSTQSFEVRGPYPTQVFLASLNNPSDVLNDTSGGFIINDGSVKYTIDVPDDVLYSALTVTETSAGETSLIKPFDDGGWPRFGSIQYQNEVCLSYTADDLPEDTTSPTPWLLNSDDPDEVLASVLGGILTYGTGGTGTRTVYLNNTPLPDAPSLQTEVNFRLRLASDATGGTGDSQVRFGLSAPGMTIGLGFVTTVLGARYVVTYDLNNGGILAYSPFDYLDGDYHTYRIVRTPGRGTVEIFIDP